MSLNDIILRDTSYPPLTDKGAALTYGEMDGNFIELYAYLVTMNQGGGVPAFSMATPYTGTVWVSYAGKIYRHIGAGTSTGQVPTSYPAVWQEATIGELAHVQGTDQGLDSGGANAVTAAEVYDVVNNEVIFGTLAAFNTLQGLGDLKVGRMYAITDALNWGTLIVKAVTASKVAAAAQVAVRLPDPAQLHPDLVWTKVQTYAASDIVQWDSLAYVNMTGSVESVQQGKVRIDLTAPQANITPTGAYNYAIGVYDGTNYMGVVAHGRVTIRGHPFGASVGYVGVTSPFPYVPTNDVKFLGAVTGAYIAGSSSTGAAVKIGRNLVLTYPATASATNGVNAVVNTTNAAGVALIAK